LEFERDPVDVEPLRIEKDLSLASWWRGIGRWRDG
jgi:hypothetical protein